MSNIEDAIKQGNFGSEYEKLFVNVLYTSSWLYGEFTTFLKPYGISQQQYNVLRILRGQKDKPASVNLIIERMVDKMSNASRLVEKLRQKGLVERKLCSSDRRQVDVLITKKGLSLLTELDDKVSSFINFSDRIDIDKARSLNSLLDKLRK